MLDFTVVSGSTMMYFDSQGYSCSFDLTGENNQQITARLGSYSKNLNLLILYDEMSSIDLEKPLLYIMIIETGEEIYSIEKNVISNYAQTGWLTELDFEGTSISILINKNINVKSD